MSVQEELDRAQRLGEELEALIVQRAECSADERNVLLIGYWSLVFDFHKSILLSIRSGFHGSAFALVRPVVEALIRSHVALLGSDDDVRLLRSDEYRVNFGTIGPWIDREFRMDNFFTNFLAKARDALHSFTHSGLSQVSRRFDGHNLTPRYKDDEIIEVIRATTSAVWMVTNLVTKRFGFVDEANRAEELFLEWGRAAHKEPGA
jgi:hypothetical protein